MAIEFVTGNQLSPFGVMNVRNNKLLYHYTRYFKRIRVEWTLRNTQRCAGKIPWKWNWNTEDFINQQFWLNEMWWLTISPQKASGGKNSTNSRWNMNNGCGIRRSIVLTPLVTKRLYIHDHHQISSRIASKLVDVDIVFMQFQTFAQIVAPWFSFIRKIAIMKLHVKHSYLDKIECSVQLCKALLGINREVSTNNSKNHSASKVTH